MRSAVPASSSGASQDPLSSRIRTVQHFGKMRESARDKSEDCKKGFQPGDVRLLQS